MDRGSGRAPLSLAIAATGTALAACATAVDRPAELAGSDRQCFLPRQVNGFHALDDDTVHVTVGVDTVYELEIVGVCPTVDWSQRIGIRSTGGGNWVCQGFDAELLVPSPTGIRECPVTMVRRLSEAEVRAVENRDE